MKQINEYISSSIIIEKSEIDDVFKKQDEFLKKMINRWESDDKLKPFDKYFQWKSKEISTGEFKSLSKDDIKEMIFKATEISDDNFNDKADNVNDWFKDPELESILDAIQCELINIIGIFK